MIIIKYLNKITKDNPFFFTSDYKYTINRFKKTFNYSPDLKHPKTFNEKINWRKLFIRKNIFKIFADKIEVRKYVEDIMGNEILVKVFQVTDKPETIDYSNLPHSFIIKASHGSGWNKIVINKSLLNEKEINDYFTNILKLDYYYLGREWCYKNLPPRLIIEELLLDNNGALPVDYKFFCFNGVVRFIQVDFNRFTNHTRNLYDPNFEVIDCQYHYPLSTLFINPPENFDNLKKIASKLSKDLDFIRVDLYSINNRVYFGELTCYPENGFGKFQPPVFDLAFGDYWKVN